MATNSASHDDNAIVGCVRHQWPSKKPRHQTVPPEVDLQPSPDAQLASTTTCTSSSACASMSRWSAISIVPAMYRSAFFMAPQWRPHGF
eukprot:10595579-Heterocapsa_arctica.AAC.1